MSYNTKAAVFKGPGELEVREVDLGELKEGEVLVKVKACGICGSDLNIFRRDPPIPKYWAGHEISGEVAELGDGVIGLSKGTRVAVAPLIPCGRCDECRSGRENICSNCLFISYNLRGGFAEYVVAPSENVFELPGTVGHEAAVLVEPLADVLHSFGVAGGVEGKRVVVIGCGTIGLLTVAAARALGAESVVAVGKYPHQAELARTLGAGACLAAGEPDLVGGVGEALDGRRADVVFETVGGYGTDSITQAIDILRPAGTIVLSGVHYSTPEMNLKWLTEKEIQLKGTQRYKRADFMGALGLLGRRAIRSELLVTHKVPLDGIMDGYEVAFAKDANRAVKVVVCP